MTVKEEHNKINLNNKYLSLLNESYLFIPIFQKQIFNSKFKITQLSNNFRNISSTKFSDKELYINKGDLSNVLNYLQLKIHDKIKEDF